MDSSVEPAQKTDAPVLTADGTKLTQAEIDRIVGDAIDLLDGNTQTRSGNPRTVASIEPVRVELSGAPTRGGEESDGELFYVVNFADDEGFSVIAADERIKDEVVLFVGHGSLDAAEVENPELVENPGMRIALERLDGYAAASIARYEAWADSMEVVLAAAGIDPPTGQPQVIEINPIGWGEWETVSGTTIHPMIPVEWGQGYPFNTTVVANTPWSTTPAGCAAIATVQLMAYWGYPTSYGGLNLSSNIWTDIRNWSGTGWNRSGRYKNWSGSMSNAPQNIRQTVADLIWYAGEDMYMNWGPTTSGTSSENAISLLGSLGYSVSPYISYSKTPVVSSLLNDRPVYIRGSTQTSGEGGHAWFIDGYLKKQRHYYVEYVYGTDFMTPTHSEIEIGDTEYSEYFHNNWGWNGTANGYYTAGLFYAGVDIELNSDGNSSPVGQTPQHNLRYYLHIWTNIYH